MLGQAISVTNKKYNVIILAGGAGSRMGTASDFIPKALTKLGNMRAIDYIIERYHLIAERFIIGTSYHADLLTSYVRGQYRDLAKFSFEKPEDLKNNAYSTAFCLDNADSRFGTIVTFCDLILLNNMVIADDSLLYVSDKTSGFPGTFRHSLIIDNKGYVEDIQAHSTPVERSNGLLGTFVFANTPLLKSIIYSKYSNLHDFTEDVIADYVHQRKVSAVECQAVYEFGTEESLEILRKAWENG
jgi:NDP-sugar pyrophosphorylase family protein